jgi:hypothetical protein
MKKKQILENVIYKLKVLKSDLENTGEILETDDNRLKVIRSAMRLAKKLR